MFKETGLQKEQAKQETFPGIEKNLKMAFRKVIGHGLMAGLFLLIK